MRHHYVNTLCVCVCAWLVWKSVECFTDRNDKRMHFGLLEGKQQLFFLIVLRSLSDTTQN